MHRPTWLLILTVVVGLILAACASPSGSPDASSGGEPSTAAESQEPAASEGGGGGNGGGGGGIGRQLPDGNWSGGEASIEMSGDATASGTAPLSPMISFTDGDSTILTYASADGAMLISIAIYSDSFAVSVTTAEAVGGGGTTTSCSVDWGSTDDNNVSADFSCPDSPVFTMTGSQSGSADIDGSFNATR